MTLLDRAGHRLEPASDIGRALSRISLSETLAQLGVFITGAVADMGLSATAGGMLTGPKAESRDMFYFNNWPASWFEVYEARKMPTLDPVVRWAMASGSPITWMQLIPRLDPADPGHELFQIAAQHGYREGFALPVRTLAGHLGLFSVAGDRGAISVEEQSFLQVVGAAAINQGELLDSKSGVKRPVPSFTERERDCVALLVQGLTERAIAAELGISPVTARFHLDNARVKLGASSRAHLADLAAGLTKSLLRTDRDPK